MKTWPTKKLGDPQSNPTIVRDGSLITRLIPIILGGFDKVLDKKEQLYVRLLSRLVDKSFDEYMSAREYLLEETKSGDKLAYRFHIISHLENCVNALNRAATVFEVVRGSNNLGKIITRITKKKIERLSVSKIRNAVEHLDKDIHKGVWRKGLFLDVDEKYKEICINDNCISFLGLIYMIKQYHNLVLEIFGGLPNRWEGGKFYYDKRKS